MWRWMCQGMALLALGACVSNGDDEFQTNASEVIVSNGDEVSKEATSVAESLRQPENRPRLVPLSLETSGALNKNWSGFGFRLPSSNNHLTEGLVFYPLSADARRGSYVVVLPNEEEELAAIVSYVPDSESREADTLNARKLLVQLETDAKEVQTSGAVKMQALNVGALGRLLSRLFQGKKVAAVAAEAVELRVLKRATSGDLWLGYRSLQEDLRSTDGFVQRLINIRHSLNNRKVVLLASPVGTKCSEFIEPCREWAKNMTTLFKSQVQGRENIAIALTAKKEHAAVLLWALRNKIPVVLSTYHSADKRTVLRLAADDAFQMDEATPAGLSALLDDPAVLDLITVIKIDSTEESLLALGSVADEAVVIDAHDFSVKMRNWLRSLEHLVEF